MSAKNKSTWTVISLMMAGLLMLTGCATSNANATENTDTIECSVIPSQLKEANATLKTAKADLKKSEGTPAEVDAKATIAEAEAAIKELNTQATECEASGDATITTASTSSDTCEPQFKQVAVDRAKGSKVDPRFDGLTRPIIKNKSLSAEEKSKALRDVDLKLAASNAQTLAFWAYALKLYDDPNNWKPLVEGGEIKEGACLSTKGQVLFAKYEGAVSAQGVDYSAAEAPQSGVNSGINGDTAVVDGNVGVGGDRTSVVITLANGSKMMRLVRCGNIVFPKTPGLPKGPTDNPPLCPPGTVGTPPDCNNRKWQTPTTEQDGWDRRGTDNGVTDGGESRRQQESGDTRGNAGNDQVANGNGTTPDTKTSGGGGPVAPDAKPGGDSQSGGKVDNDNTNQNAGGTNGDTCVPDPIAGISC